MDCAVEQSGFVSLEQVRAAFKCRAPRAVSNALIPFLREEWRSNGDRRVINEIAESIGGLMYTWFQRVEVMSHDDKKALYLLLRPGEVLMKTLLQYNTLQRQNWQQAAGGGDGLLSISLESLPGEWHGRAALAAAYLRALAPKSVVVVEKGGVMELRVGALEYVLYHMCRALIPLVGMGERQGMLVAESPVLLLSSDLTHYFLPVALPATDKSTSGTESRPKDQSPLNKIRPLLHGTQPDNSPRAQSISVDLLDTCDEAQANDLTQYFVFCAALAWLPLGADPAMWVPNIGHIVGLNLFYGIIHYMARGEKQFEHIKASDANRRKRVEMNLSLRAVVRQQLERPLTKTISLVTTAGKRLGATDSSEMWLPFFVLTVRAWARYAMPWHISSNLQVPATATELSEVWRKRMMLVIWGVGAPMYAPVLEDLMQLLVSPNVDLLARAPRSAIDDASVFNGSNLRGVDALVVIERITAAFSAPELRAILVAADSLWGGSHGRVSLLSPRFNALVADARRALVSNSEFVPPAVVDSSLFVSPRNPLLKDLVIALQRVVSLCDRQVNLLKSPSFLPSSTIAQQTTSVVLSLVAHAFSTEPSGPISAAESASARSEELKENKKRVFRVMPGLTAVFQAEPADVDAIKHESVPFMLADRPPASAVRRSGNELASVAAAATPEMERGSLTPRGRWELKTGRRKFTAMSLVSSPLPTPSKHGGGDYDALLPRGPHAVYAARSYENQWVLDQARCFNGVANRYYQRALDALELCCILVPEALRTYELDFRFIAAYQNMRFMALVLLLLMILRYLFF
ncbi:hypothetical protein H4218_000742 [Coemansia sp. IMI 209128]|nr:hypothetical protein H4218_000742 [Coemansia sp. IMI 209128]